MSDARKINFYEISVTNGLDCRACIDAAINQTNAFNASKARERQKPASSGGIVQIIDIRNVSHYHYCLSKLIRDEFPEVTDKTEDTVEVIEAENDPNKGIHDETHFVISKNPNYNRPIIAVESCMRGPKYTDIHRYLESMLIHSGAQAEFIFEPVFAFEYKEFLDRMKDVAQIKMMFYREDVQQYSGIDPDTGQLLRIAMNYGDPEYIALEFNVNFQKKKHRYPTDGLVSRVKHLVNILINNPDAKNLIKRLDVKAEDSNFGDRLRLFDLIESKVASEVTADRKRPRSQYYDSTSLYAAIRAQIETDFGN